MPGGFSDPGLAAGPTFRKAAPMASPAQPSQAPAQHQDPAPPHGALKVQSPACAGAGGGAVGTFHISLFATFATFSLVLAWAGVGAGVGEAGR